MFLFRCKKISASSHKKVVAEYPQHAFWLRSKRKENINYALLPEGIRCLFYRSVRQLATSYDNHITVN